jgi:hypothetical protein
MLPAPTEQSKLLLTSTKNTTSNNPFENITDMSSPIDKKPTDVVLQNPCVSTARSLETQPSIEAKILRPISLETIPNNTKAAKVVITNRDTARAGLKRSDRTKALDGNL